MLYLLQLVQALKFETPPSSSTSRHRHPRAAALERTTLEDFLVDRSVRNQVLGNNFHWYLMVECEDKIVGKMYSKVAFHFMTRVVEVSSFFVVTGPGRSSCLIRKAATRRSRATGRSPTPG
jgi:phosphatidylinositol 3-kinase